MQPEPRQIVVIDDERPILMTLEALLRRHGYEVHLGQTAAAGLELVRKHQPDLVLLDLGLPDADGLKVLAQLRRDFAGAHVIILTAQDSLSNAIESIKLGAFHFISKPYVPEELLSLTARVIEQRALVRETETLREQTAVLSRKLEEAEQALAPVHTSRRMREIEGLIARLAPSEANVLLTGESGVGKEVLANSIHRQSRRRDGPMVKLNCAAFPQNMIEAELFGYVKGAFTGAVTDFPGMIAEANSGTLFLDEIAEMPVELQTRFLRVLQEREFRPIGSTKTVQADFRLIAATNRDPARALHEGKLRHDLYYRLKTFEILIPPLRERRDDIPSLVSIFTKRFAGALGKAEPRISPEAFNFLLSYPWPGNVRELQNAIEHGMVLAEDVITEKHLPLELQLPPQLQEARQKAGNGDGLNLEAREREAILRALAECHGNKKKAATLLGIHRPTLYNKMKRYGIQI